MAKRLGLLLVMLLTCLLLAGCDTKNIGTGGIYPPEPPTPSVYPPADMAGGEQATWVVSFWGGYRPFTISMDMGGGTTENVTEQTIEHTENFSYTFTMVNPSRTESASYTYSVTTANDPEFSLNGWQRGFTGFYTVGPTPNNPPSIDDVVFEDGVLYVYVSDADGDELTVTVIEPTGLYVDASSRIATQAAGVAAFTWNAFDGIAGGSGDTTITVTDDYGGETTTTYPIVVPGYSIPAGALAAVPAYTQIQTGDEVMVTVVAGDFPAAAPFQYLNSVSLTVEEGAEFVDGTLNVGAPGGEQKDPDGLWANMSSAPNSFLLPDDFMIQELPSNDAGRVRIDFNVTPIGGSQVTTGGALFNFALQFDHAGTYTLGFEEFNMVQRTYYSGADAQSQVWDDISNDYPDVPNTIEVT